MFPLFTATMPSNAPELQRLLSESLQRLFLRVDQPVTVRDQQFPELAEIRINLDGAQLRHDAPRPSSTDGGSSTGLNVAQFEVSARDISAGPATASLRLHAHEVQLDQARDRTGDIVLVLRRATAGEVEVSAERAEIEKAIAAVATKEAGKHGVAIDQVQLTVKTRGERSVDGEVRLRAKKLFFSTIVRIGAKLDLDNSLNARLSSLSCRGDGAIGALACGALQPHLQKLDGRSFSLMALPLGEVRLRDVRITAGDRITVTAEFGA